MTVLCFAVRNIWALVGVTVLAGGGLIPIAKQGHAAGASGHDAAVTDLALHLLGAAVWLGGLVALVLLRGTLERGRIGVVLARYSTVAIVCFVVVAASGVGSAAIRLGDWAGADDRLRRARAGQDPRPGGARDLRRRAAPLRSSAAWRRTRPDRPASSGGS